MLAEAPTNREVSRCPRNRQGEDRMRGAPSTVEPARLKELSIALNLRKPKPVVKKDAAEKE